MVYHDVPGPTDPSALFLSLRSEGPAMWADWGRDSAILAPLLPLPDPTAGTWQGLARSAVVPEAPALSGGVCGWFGYEAGAWMERQPVPAATPPLPLVWLGRAPAMATWRAGRWRVAGEVGAADGLRARLAAAGPPPPLGAGAGRVVGAGDPEAYRRGVRRALAHLRAGDCYQVNLARTLEVEGVGDPLAIWRRLRQLNPARRSVLLETPHGAVVSNSPELLLGVRGPRLLSVPIKGTAPLAEDPEHLRRSAKERAELTMIVDLVRADLGRVARPGSVRAGPRRVGRVGHVWHAMRRVEAELAAGRDGVDAFAAVFPAGSVTGAPKVRAMEILRDLEAGPRGVYCGALGWFGSDGGAAWNVAIRTISVVGGHAWVQVGAGIVLGSDPERELAETTLKARRLLDAMGVG